MKTTPATRQFTDDPLPDDVLYDILDHARFAPNGGNRQAWHVIAVRDPDLKRQLAELWELAQREDHAFYEAGLVPFVASEAYWRNPYGGVSTQPLDLDEARNRPSSDARGTRPEIILAAPVVLVVTLDLTRVTAMDSGLGRLSISAGGSVYPFAHNILLAARDSGIRRRGNKRPGPPGAQGQGVARGARRSGDCLHDPSGQAGARDHQTAAATRRTVRDH